MKVKDKMVTNVVTSSPTEVVPQVARMMVERQASSVVVVDKGSPVGIVTERDFLERVLATKKDPSTTKIKEIMSSPLVDVSPEASVFEAIRLMHAKKFSQLPVTKDGRLVGIIARADLMSLMATFFASRRM